jgi:hypothetical protein
VFTPPSFFIRTGGDCPLLIILKNEKKFEQQRPNKTRELENILLVFTPPNYCMG